MSRKEGWEGNEYRSACPKCKQKSFLWNKEKQIGWCFFCEEAIYQPPPGLCITPGRWRIKERRVKSTEAYTPDKELNLQSVFPEGPTRKYLYKREITTEMLYGLEKNKEGLRTDGFGRIFFPVCSPSPEFKQGWIYREIEHKGYFSVPGLKKKKGGYVFGLQGLDPANKGILLVEGPFDVLTPELYHYAVALLGTNLWDTTMFWLRKLHKKVFLWLDPDEAGIGKTKVIAERLRIYDIPTEIIDHPDEPGDCRSYEFLRKLKIRIKEGE